MVKILSKESIQTLYIYIYIICICIALDTATALYVRSFDHTACILLLFLRGQLQGARQARREAKAKEGGGARLSSILIVA